MGHFSVCVVTVVVVCVCLCVCVCTHVCVCPCIHACGFGYVCLFVCVCEDRIHQQRHHSFGVINGMVPSVDSVYTSHCDHYFK